MRKLDFNEYKTSKAFGQLFELSIDRANFSSPMFIRRLMSSDMYKMYENKSYLILSTTSYDVIDGLNEMYKASTKSPMYPKSVMYWIGYIYASISFLYKIAFKNVYKMLPPKEIVKYYNIFHTFDIEEACERIMENINYCPPDLTKEGVKILRRLYSQDKKL